MDPSWTFFILCKPPLEMTPKILNGIEVWRLCWPLHDIKIMVFEPAAGLLASVLGVVILLKNDILMIEAIILQGRGDLHPEC